MLLQRFPETFGPALPLMAWQCGACALSQNRGGEAVGRREPARHVS